MPFNSKYIWESYYQDIGLPNELRSTYVDYVEELSEKKIPPIFEDIHLSQLLGLAHEDLNAMVHGTYKFYREFSIKKRTGGSRIIRSPYPSLLAVQRWILENILCRCKISNCATGFRKNYSILNNALIHCNRDELIKLDLKDFFPSISFRRVIWLFINLGYPENVAFCLARLCTLDDQLPQGAATSPAISNIICNRLDQRLLSFSRLNKLRYTRYADDMVFSGKKASIEHARKITGFILHEGFQINDKKTRLVQKSDRKIVTGLDITSGKPRVLRRFRREIMKDVYFVWSSGLENHVARRKIFDPNYISHLEGRVRFWQSIEPNNKQMLKTLSRVKILQGRHLKQL